MIWTNFFGVCLLLIDVVYSIVTDVELFYLSYYEKSMMKLELAGGKCTSLPSWARNKARSAVTDECLMLFSYPDCQGRTYELPKGRGNYFPYFDDSVDSLRTCKEHEKGRSNNWVDNDANQQSYADLTLKKIKLYGDYDNRGLLKDTVITPYCTTLDSWDYNKVSSIDTEECVMVYSHPHCKGWSIEVKRGNTPRLYYLNDRVQSFRPCTKESIFGEVRLSALVTKFELFEMPDEVAMLKPKEYTKKSTFTNNGTAGIKQPFEMSFETKEKTITSFEQTSSSAHDVSVSATVTVEGEGGIPLMAQAKVTASLTREYSYHKEKGASKTETREIANKTIIKVGEEITVPSCSIYEARSFSKVMRGYPVKFVTEMEVSGKQGERQMTADQVRAQLSEGMTYLSDKDEETVIAQGHGISRTDFGIETGFYGKGTAIKDCAMKP